MLKSVEQLEEDWRALNERYFAGVLPPMAIVWSRRLTSSVGMFVSRGGPRPRTGDDQLPTRSRREIRLSEPLMARLAARTPYAEQELLNTLAHEMIHQWQFDILKRKPNHGPDFVRKMTEMNRSGLVAITIYHSLHKEVQALAQFAWRCTDCGRIYRRQRKTIQPRRHLCGTCRGRLQEMLQLHHMTHTTSQPAIQQPLAPCPPSRPAQQLTLGWGSHTKPLPATR